MAYEINDILSPAFGDTKNFSFESKDAKQNDKTALIREDLENT